MSDEQNNYFTDIKTPKRKRVRSPYLFPAYDFGLARQIAERVEKDGAGSLSEETLAIALRLSAKSSGFQLKTLTARQFGLLAKHGNVLSTTPLAKTIFKPTDEDEKRRALIQSFLALPLFREVATRFRGQPLPQEGPALRNILEREFKIDVNRVSDAERVLMDSARDTGVLVTAGNNIYLSTEQPTQITTARKEGEHDNYQAPPSPLPSSAIPPSSSSRMLTISEEDLASFDDQDFWKIWDALGKIVRARGKRQQKEQDTFKEEEINRQSVGQTSAIPGSQTVVPIPLPWADKP